MMEALDTVSFNRSSLRDMRNSSRGSRSCAYADWGCAFLDRRSDYRSDFSMTDKSPMRSLTSTEKRMSQCGAISLAMARGGYIWGYFVSSCE